MKYILADAACFSKKCFGALSIRRNTCRILLYHSVGERDYRNDKMGLSVPEDIFYMQMKYLKDEGFILISLRELVDKIRNNIMFSDKSVVITFDDGYRSALTKAMPILRSFGFAATVFINVYFVERKIRGNFYWQRWETLSWDDVMQLQKAGLLIGSHALSHRRLGEMDNKEMEYEILTSKDIIECRIKERVDAFSYPHGSFNKVAKKILRKNNFTSSCASIEGCVGSRPDIFALRRTEITSFDDTCSRFERKLLGCYDWLRYTKFNA